MTQHPPSSLAVLVLFGPRLAPWHDLIMPSLDTLWSGHPPVFSVLPPGTAVAPGPGVITGSQSGWVALLREALLALRARQPDCRYVFSFIEDHCPLHVVDAVRVARFLDDAMASDRACTSFVTYDWPWDKTAPDDRAADGRTMTWRERAIEDTPAGRVARVPDDFFRYNQCQPSLWNIDYYLSLCDQALAAGIDNPWAFEEAVFPRQAPHFIADYAWPSVHHGFMAQGVINPEAIRVVSRRVAPLRRRLIAEYLTVRGVWPLLADVWLRPAWQQLRRALRQLLRGR